MPKAVFDSECTKYIHSFKVQEKDRSRTFVYCKVCVKYPNIVQMYSSNRKKAPITNESGTRYRKDGVEKHFSTLYHAKCKEAEQMADSDSLS